MTTLMRQGLEIIKFLSRVWRLKWDQLVNLLSKRIHEDLPNNIVTKLGEEVSATTLKCGRELEEPIKKVREKVVKETVETQKEEKASNVLPKMKAALKVKAYKPRIPFLARLVQHKLDKEFFDVFKKLYINIPFCRCYSTDA